MATFAMIGGAMVNLDQVRYFEENARNKQQVFVYFVTEDRGSQLQRIVFEDTMDNVMAGLGARPVSQPGPTVRPKEPDAPYPRQRDDGTYIIE